jgi:hypothetical protein
MGNGAVRDYDAAHEAVHYQLHGRLALKHSQKAKPGLNYRKNGKWAGQRQLGVCKKTEKIGTRIRLYAG